MKFSDPLTPSRNANGVAAFICHRFKGLQGRQQEPAEPNAFTHAAVTDPVHSVIPVASANQWQTVRAKWQVAIQGAGAMFIECCGFFGERWLKECVVFAFHK